MPDKRYSIDFVGRDKTGGAVQSAQKNLKSLEGSVLTLRNVWGSVSGVLAAVGISQVFREAASASIELEKTQLRLDAVYKATGGTVGLARREIEEYIKTLSGKSVFGQNEIRDAASVMLTFKGIQEETFTTGLRLAADMSAVMGQDLKSSVLQVGKALEDPIRGVGALAEVGVSFTETQRDMIKTMVEAGEVAKAQGVIVEALEGQFGGTAGKLKEGLYGSMVAVREEWARLMEAAGNTATVQGGMAAFFGTAEGGLRAIRETIEQGNWAETYLRILGAALPAGPLSSTLSAGAEWMGQPSGREASGRIRAPADYEFWQGGDAEKFYADQAKAESDKQKQIERDAAKLKELEEKRKKERADWVKESAKLTKEEIAHADELEALRWEYFENEKQRKLEAIRIQAEWVESNDEAINDAISVGQDLQNERDKESAAKLEKMKNDGQALVNSINDERIILWDWFREKAKLIDDLEKNNFEIGGGWQAQRVLLTKELQERESEIISKEAQKRWGINKVYQKLDLESTEYFLGQMSVLMTTNSRAMFEVGKAAAIGETIIQTYRAAQGAFAALASIPFVGPALGAAAAAAAIAGGMARVQAIQGQTFGSGSGVTPVAPASPITGLPTSAAANLPPTEFEQQTSRIAPRVVNVQIESDSGVVSAAWVRDKLLPTISEALGDGVTITGF